MKLARIVFCVLPVIAFVAPLGGCASTTVRKNPDDNDKGIRYYRPKPYLKIQPVLPEADNKVEPGDMVSISIEYLPDFNEEYSIHICAGLGVNKTKVTLDNGWNLTGLDVDVDSKTSENLTAIAEIAKAIPKPTSKEPIPGPGAKNFVTQATNVPIGYYEAVVNQDPSGVRRLYGWRYVGFAPFVSCPINASGGACAPCDTETIYGLVFENKMMVFKPLNDAKSTRPVRQEAPTTEPEPQKDGPSPAVQGQIKKIKKETLESIIKITKENISENDVLITRNSENSAKFEFEIRLEKPSLDRIKMIPEAEEKELGKSLTKIIVIELSSPVAFATVRYRQK